MRKTVEFTGFSGFKFTQNIKIQIYLRLGRPLRLLRVHGVDVLEHPQQADAALGAEHLERAADDLPMEGTVDTAVLTHGHHPAALASQPLQVLERFIEHFQPAHRMHRAHDILHQPGKEPILGGTALVLVMGDVEATLKE